MWTRSCIAAALFLGGLSASAQADGLRSFEAQAAMDRSNLKYVIQAVRDLDPNGEVFHSDDMKIIRVRSSAQITDSELRSAIQATGVQLRAGTPDLAAYLPAPNPDTPPIFVVTNNETEDLARYQAAAAVWNQAHPDRAVAITPLHLLPR